MENFAIEIPVNNPKAMEDFQKLMNDLQDETNLYVENLAKELNCSVSCAMDVHYLRSRSRWTKEIENELIRLHLIGEPPNVLSGWSNN